VSGTGHSNTAAPSRLTPIAQDQPIGLTPDGHPIVGTLYFNQMITRILAYLGQPGPSGGGGASGGNNLTVSEQLTNLTNAIIGLQQGPGTAAPGISGRLSIVEEILARMPWLMPRAPKEPRRIVRIPAPPPLPIPLRELPGPPAVPLVTEVQLTWIALQNPNNAVLFTVPRAMIVTGITGRLEVAQGAAATITVLKAASGTALTAGTALHTGSFNANGTAATNQTLTLAALAAISLAAGDSIGIQTTGTWTTSAGGITIGLSG
jgi:hypothetical protein